MITQKQFDSLQPGDKIQSGANIGEIQALFSKVILVLWQDEETNFITLNELNSNSIKIVKPIKYNQGFEVREYPERPVVLVGDTKPDKLRFLVAIEEETIICISEGEDRFYDKPVGFSRWKLIKKVD